MRESQRSTIRADSYANYPSSNPNLQVHLNRIVKSNHFFLFLKGVVLQVKMKVVEQTLSIASTYCNFR